MFKLTNFHHLINVNLMIIELTINENQNDKHVTKCKSILFHTLPLKHKTVISRYATDKTIQSIRLYSPCAQVTLRFIGVPAIRR